MFVVDVAFLVLSALFGHHWLVRKLLLNVLLFLVSAIKCCWSICIGFLHFPDTYCWASCLYSLSSLVFPFSSYYCIYLLKICFHLIKKMCSLFFILLYFSEKLGETLLQANPILIESIAFFFICPLTVLRRTYAMGCQGLTPSQGLDCMQRKHLTCSRIWEYWC